MKLNAATPDPKNKSFQSLTSTIAHCCSPGLAIELVIFILRLVAPEQDTNSPGLPASQLASSHEADVISLGPTAKFPTLLII
eukprot:CCRYP_007512-RC/>CCRYP_007512-RC protein AED:0.47 eAED:0.60 QI:0/0/0/1/0/0/2/0/81